MQSIIILTEAKKPRLWVHIMHGMAEHSERHKTLENFLISTILASLPMIIGHGITGSEANSLIILQTRMAELLIKDVWHLIKHIAQNSQSLVILGHSMGSYSLRFCQMYSCRLADDAKTYLPL